MRKNRGRVALSTAFLLFVMLLSPAYLKGQESGKEKRLKKSSLFKPTQHMIGVRGGYNFSSLATRPDLEYKGIKTYKNLSLLYTYYHTLWGEIALFGLQTGVSHLEEGYLSYDGEVRYSSITIPLISQFHFDFWRMRLLVNGGCFAGYRSEISWEDGSSFNKLDNRADAGIIGGAGIAFILHPIELHIEGNYHFSLVHLHAPNKPNPIVNRLFSQPQQVVFSVALHFRL